MTVTGRAGLLAGLRIEAPELDQRRARDMPGAVLRGLTNIEDGFDQRRRVTYQHRGRFAAASRAPGGHPADKLAGKVLVTDLQALSDELGAILFLVEDEDQRSSAGTSQPSQEAKAVAQDDR